MEKEVVKSLKMCIREEKTGLNYLTADDGSPEYMCCNCKFSEECHKQTAEMLKREKEKEVLNGNASLLKWG